MSVRKEMLETMCIHANGLHTGETIRVNHTECPAGTDTRGRFYITRKPDVLLGYCHNCGNSVTKYVAPDDRYRYKANQELGDKVVTTQWEQPLGVCFNKDTSSIPVEAESYRHKYRLTRAECVAYDIEFAPEYFGIMTPVIHDNTMFGVQIRPLTRRGSKYMTLLSSNLEMGGFLKSESLNSPSTEVPIVITEDYISAVRVSSAGYFAWCNYGIQVKPKMLHKLAKRAGGRDIKVWLDNDAPHVQDNAEEIRSVLKLFGTECEVIDSLTEPKHISTGDIITIVGKV